MHLPYQLITCSETPVTSTGSVKLLLLFLCCCSSSLHGGQQQNAAQPILEI
jgi:hypothetical protein